MDPAHFSKKLLLEITLKTYYVNRFRFIIAILALKTKKTY